jgi:hypothetical protein
LYTNPETGVGILNANEPPPFAKDINRFKNVVFYSNTRTKQRLTSFQLLGLSNINSGDKITITNDVDSNTYTFVSGVQQEVGITVETTTTSTSLQNKYFTINSANDNKSYCVYYILNNQNIQSAIVSGGNTLVITCYANHNLSSVPPSAQIKLTGIVTGTGDPDINGIYTFYPDPFNPAKFAVTIPTVTSVDVSNASFSIYFSDKTTKIVNILTADSYTDIADKTANTLNTLLYDFYVNKASNVLTVTNVEQGTAQNPDSATVGSLFSIVVNKQGDGEDAANKQVLLSSLTSAAQAIEQTAQSLVRVINKNDSVVNAFYTSSETTPPGQMILEAKTLGENPFYVIASTIPAGQSFNPDISPISPLPSQNTNIVEILVDGSLRTNNPHGLQNDDAIVITNVDSTSPLNQGFDGYKKVTVTSPDTFTVQYTTYSTVSGIQGAWSTPSNTIVSDNEVKANRVYYSKPNEPEAVPVLNYFDISAEDKEIVRIYPLRNSLFVFKEDGTYRISGETSPFVVSLLDSSCVVRAPDSVSATNNIVYAWTTKGVTPISEAGASQEVSRPIDTEILRLSSSKFTNFRTITWGVGYDSDSSYTVYTNYNVDDEYATIAFRYCTLTNSWTNVTRSQACGIIHIEEDKMYLGSATDNIINQERKSFDRTDYADKDFSLQISSGSIGVNTKQEQTISFTSVSEINVGDVITQEQELSVFLFNNLLKQLDTDPAIISAGTNTYYDDIKAVAGDNMRNKIVELSQRLDLDPAVSFSDYEERIANKNFPITQVLISSPTTISAGAKELTQFTIPTNVPFDLNIYNSKYFFVSSSYTNFVIWFNVDGTGIIPSLSGKIPVEVPLSSLSILNETDLATAISTIISTDMSTMFELSSYSLSNTFTIENQTIGPVQDATAETSGFSLNIVTTGSWPELLNGREITITGNSSIPSINGVHIVSNTTYGTSTTFTIPIDVTTASFSGSFITNINSQQDIKTCFNHIVSRLNLDPGLVYNSYKGVTETTLLEAVIVDVDKTKKQIAIKSPLEWIVGSSTIYNAINCEIQYAPITMGDTLNIKQLFDTTIMLKDRNITKFVASFSSDLKPEFTEVLFNGEGNGIFGYYAKGFGYGNFGGQSNNAPFRTLVPLQNQRCRFLNYKIGHNTAREVFVLYGISLTGNIGISFRGYR